MLINSNTSLVMPHVGKCKNFLLKVKFDIVTGSVAGFKLDKKIIKTTSHEVQNKSSDCKVQKLLNPLLQNRV
jgi:hypothetical protein